MASLSNNKMPVSKDAIDESLYSRQLYVLGREAMTRMAQSDVLIIGLRGLGAEIAKNVALAGVKSLTIYDKDPTEIQDLSTQFFLRVQDVGKPRAEASLARLAELNSYVPISVHTEELSDEFLSKFKVIVLTNSTLETQVKINNFTHEKGIAFINVETRGLFGSLFNDFGESFSVVDTNGEDPAEGLIASIDDNGDVMMVEGARHGLEDGDFVTFTGVEGIDALNNTEPRKVSVKGPFSFNIGSVSGLGTYTRGGTFHQIKQPQIVQFESLASQLSKPDFIISDFAKFGRPPQLHIGFQALHGFSNKHQGKLPEPYNKEHAAEFLHIARTLYKQNESLFGGAELDVDLLTKVSYQARGDLPPITAFFGGVAGQEVLKACSGKFSPVKQYLYFDSLESLPKDVTIDAKTTAPQNSRYDGQLAVFGSDFQEQIANTREFLVGAGAIGCETLKIWTLMGLGTGPRGKIYVTDNDTIERSNLNRQFLFRSKDLGKPKSVVAAAAVIDINPDLTGKIDAREDKVGPDTEDIFDDDFWTNLDGVTNALDNVEARTYVDSRCVFFRKPLLESGTLGTKGNTQVVYPFLTESYSSSRDPPEKAIPLCTLRSFPSKIDHTIAWAKNLFGDLFTLPMENANMYLTQPNFAENLENAGQDLKTIVDSVQRSLVTEKPLTFEECINWARREFQTLYHDNILQLLYNFPKDATTSNGTPFWSGSKRAPTAISFNSYDPTHLGFVIAAANLHAFNYGIQGFTDIDRIRRVIDDTVVPEFSPSASVKIQVDENEAEAEDAARTQEGNQLTDVIQEELDSLPNPKTLAGTQLHPAEFEKDNDSNHHIDFITAASNLRAENYGIEPADRSKTKFIAGRIIPAIATTTAAVTGLVGLELYKVIDKRDVLDDYKNGFMNLALPFFGFSEPIAASKIKFNNEEMDKIWGRFDIDGDITLKELLDRFEKEHGLTITMLSSGVRLLYAFFFPPKKLQQKYNMKITELYESVAKTPVPPHHKTLLLEVCTDDKDGEEVEVPYICLHLRK